MGIFSRFEGKMEDSLEGAADRIFDAPISPVQISKKAEKAMRHEKVVGSGKQYAPTLYTVLVNVDDDRRLFGYYPTLAGETETYLVARAAEEGLQMDGQPLVRFIADDTLKHGKIDVIAELVSAPIVAQLREEEMERYGLAPRRQPVRRTTMAAQQPPVQNQAPITVDPQSEAAFRAQQQELQAQQDLLLAQQQAAAAQAAAIEAAEATYRERVRRASQDFGEKSIPLVNPPAPVSVFDGSGMVAIPPAAPEVDEFAGLKVSTYEPYSNHGFEPQQRDAQTTAFANGGGCATPVPRGNAVRGSLIFAATNRRVDLAITRVVLGRSSSSDVILDDINASRTHAELRFEPQGVWSITDLGSMNGTYVNGRMITTCLLHSGDRIVIGSTDLFFVEE